MSTTDDYISLFGHICMTIRTIKHLLQEKKNILLSSCSISSQENVNKLTETRETICIFHKKCDRSYANVNYGWIISGQQPVIRTAVHIPTIIFIWVIFSERTVMYPLRIKSFKIECQREHRCWNELCCNRISSSYIFFINQ